MENKQDIGKAFKDRLGGLHREPGDAVWQNISASLQQQKRGGFRMPFWGKATSIVVAVVLVAIFTHPQWEQYMPEIIIKMPGEKQQNGNGNAQTNTVSGAEGNSQTVNTEGINPAVANAPAGLQNSLPNSNAATPRSQDGVIANGTNGADEHEANGTINNTYSNDSALAVANQNNSNTSSANRLANTAGISAKANANRTVAAASGTKYNSGKASANSNDASTANGIKANPAKANTNRSTVSSNASGAKSSKNTNTRTDVASVNKPVDSRTGVTPAAVTNTQNNPATANPVTATNQSTVAAQTGGTNIGNAATPGAVSAVTGTGAATPKTATTPAVAAANGRGYAKSVEGNLVYSTGNFPTITKAMADSLVVAQKAIDDKKSRERTFAQPGYALQDNLTGGEGYRNDFYVFAFVAPTNYKFGESTSLIDLSLNNHASSAETSNNFGAYLGYEFSSQFSIRTGVSSVGITQRTGNVSMGADYSGVNYANGMTNSQAATALGDSPVTLRQKTSIIEVPLEATYAMFGTRADLYFKGGVSMFFMNENQLFAENSNGSVLLGSLNRAQDFSFSGNAGFGFYYKFMRELQLNVEPGFKYYFNTFEGVNPFSLYVQAGLLYRF